MFLLCSLQPNPRRTALSDRLDPAAPAAAGKPPIPARAARMAKFKREQLIVDYLNRGVSVAEIAARVGVGQKRLRAIVRDILVRRQPHPPAEFVAIQVSRLNEALLVAFSAMSPTNLKAVDQVVRIVRELDRYGGAFAAEWRRAERSRPRRAAAPEALTGEVPLAQPDSEAEAITDEDRLFARRWLDGDELASAVDGGEAAIGGGEQRAGSIEGVVADLLRRYMSPEIPVQDLDKMDSAPELSDPFPDRPHESRAPGAAAATLDRGARQLNLGARLCGHDREAGPEATNRSCGARYADERCDRPQIPAQSLDNIQSAPGIGSAPEAFAAERREPATDVRTEAKPAPYDHTLDFLRSVSKVALLNPELASDRGGDRPRLRTSALPSTPTSS
jgi:transposase-like protein